MFALDLFNTRYERQLQEGGVDNLEARRIDDLNMRMLELLDRAKEPAYKKNPAALAGLKKQFQKIKSERDSYFKINPATGMNDTGTLGTVKGALDELGIPGNIPTEKIPGKEDLLKGKGRTYYEGAEDYAGTYSPEAIALGKRFCEHYNITDDTDVQFAIEIIDSYLDEFKAAGEPVDLKKIKSGVADAFRQVYRGMGPGPNFRKRFQETQKKNSEVSPLDQKLQRLKVQARRQFPRAHTDDEALILKLLDKETQDDQLNRQTDARQDAELRKNFALDREQEDEIEDLQTQVGVKEHGGGIGPKQHWQDLMPEQYTNDDDWYDDEDQETELRSGDYVRDTMDGESGEIFRMQGDPYERRVRILDRDGKGWYIEPSRLVVVDRNDPDVQRYFGKRRVRDMDEAEVAEGWSDAVVARRTGTPRTPYSVYIKGKKWKDFENEDHAEAVANKLKAKFKADGRDPETITIAPTDYDQPIKEDNDSEAVERAILNRIMVAHTDLLMKFGPDKVMQAAEEVAYNVGDVDEIGTSDVSAYVAQVKQILGAVAETQVNEKWSAKYKSSINCASPKGFSQKAHCAGRKK